MNEGIWAELHNYKGLDHFSCRKQRKANRNCGMQMFPSILQIHFTQPNEVSIEVRQLLSSNLKIITKNWFKLLQTKVFEYFE